MPTWGRFSLEDTDTNESTSDSSCRSSKSSLSSSSKPRTQTKPKPKQPEPQLNFLVKDIINGKVCRGTATFKDFCGLVGPKLMARSPALRVKMCKSYTALLFITGRDKLVIENVHTQNIPSLYKRTVLRFAEQLYRNGPKNNRKKNASVGVMLTNLALLIKNEFGKKGWGQVKSRTKLIAKRMTSLSVKQLKSRPVPKKRNTSKTFMNGRQVNNVIANVAPELQPRAAKATREVRTTPAKTATVNASPKAPPKAVSLKSLLRKIPKKKPAVQRQKKVAGKKKRATRSPQWWQRLAFKKGRAKGEGATAKAVNFKKSLRC